MTVVARFTKALLALVFSAAPIAVVEALNVAGLVHVTVPGWEAFTVACAPLLAMLGVGLGPANSAKPMPAPLVVPEREGVPFTVAAPDDAE